MIATLLKPLRPAPAAPAVPEADVPARYRYWRTRQLYTTFVGYAVFYFVRKNMPLALPLMERDLGITKARLGIFLTLQDVAYGISKSANGFLGDRTNARVFMAVGLLLSALMNVFFGLSSGLYTLGILWILNGWFQGMGFPPCARVLSHWFSVRERGTFWGLWNTSHQVGAGIIYLVAGVLGQHFNWQSIFIVPGIFSVAVALFVFERLRDTPSSLGLPPVEVYRGEVSAQAAGSDNLDPGAFRRLLRERVFTNPFIWLICVANFFVYAVRIALMNWLPSYLNQARGMPLTWAGAMLLVFEIAGLIGSLAAGWVSDRFLSSRRAPVCTAYMILLAVSLYLFWRAPVEGTLGIGALVFAIGFLVYGPQLLVGLFATDLATKRAAASAVGLTALFGYASGPVTGWGMGWIVDHYGWNGGFAVLLASALAGALPFALCWKAAAPEIEEAEARGEGTAPAA